jgi:phage gpG-like protein
LKKTQEDLKKLLTVMRDSMEEAVFLTESKVREKLDNNILSRRTSGLFNSVRGDVSGAGFEVKGFVSVGSADIKYAAIHEFGGTIYPKNKPLLMWKNPLFTTIRGEFRANAKKMQTALKGKGENERMWIVATKVRIPARPYMKPTTKEMAPKIAKLFDGKIKLVIEGTG